MRAVLVLAVVAVSGCGKAGSSPDAAFSACVDRGVAYYKEIGSYPPLKTAPNAGKAAEDVARGMCERSPIAFSK
jgi:hypothetical protein